MTYTFDGKIDTSKLGTNIGDYELIRQMIYHSKAPNYKEVQAVIDGIDKGIRNTWNTITKHPEMITIGTGILIGVTGNPSLGLKIAALPLTNNNKTPGKRNTNSAPVASQTKPTSKLPVKSSTSRGRGRGKKKIILINLMKRVNKTIIEEKLRERKQKIIEKLIQTELKVHKKDIKKHKKNTMI